LVINLKFGFMQSKSLLIAIAAFAVTATGAQAYVGNKYFNQSGLSMQQVQAFSHARDLRRKGEVAKARDVLVKAGVTEETIVSLRRAAKASQTAVDEAIASKDFLQFKEAIEGTPLYDIITSETDFALFIKAHELKLEHKFNEAKEILDELGIGRSQTPNRTKGEKKLSRYYGELSFEQRAALAAARQANDEETVIAILEEAGIERVKGVKRSGKDSWY
jgi:hypothetical protein